MEITITPELAEICGIHAGDGYLRLRDRNRGEVQISGNVEEKEYYDFYVIPTINRVFNLKINGKLFRNNLYGFVCYQKILRDVLIKLGFPNGKKSLEVSVPKVILNSNNLTLYSRFLRGLFDTDGHLGLRKCYGNYSLFKTNKHNYPFITITTISKNLLKDVTFMLDKLEIKYFIQEYFPKNLIDNYQYRIVINGVDRIEKWMEIIGSKNSVKYSRYLVWKKFGFCPTNLTLNQREDILKGKLDIYTVGA